MREIKFRAYVTRENFGMIYGYPIITKGKIEAFCEDITGSMFGATSWPFHLMQFTGLHDKNGKEIYEGDILKVNYIHGPHDKVCVVRWDEKNALFRLEPGRHDDLTTLTWSIHDTVFGHNVIGNIYQNPELLPQEASNREGDV